MCRKNSQVSLNQDGAVLTILICLCNVRLISIVYSCKCKAQDSMLLLLYIVNSLQSLLKTIMELLQTVLILILSLEIWLVYSSLKQFDAKKGTGKKSTVRGKTKAEKEKEKKKNQKAKGKAKKPKEKTERKKGPDRKLKPNPKIKVLEKDPFFETKEKVPFVSIPIQSKLVIRAAILDNVSMLKDLLADPNVYKVNYKRSKENRNTALDYAIRNGNKNIIELLVEDIICSKKRKVNTPPTPLLHSIDTGTYNPVNLGVRNVRKLNVSRGSREGNDAFKDDGEYNPGVEEYCFLPIQYGCDWSVVDNVMASVIKHSSGSYDKEHMIGHLIDDINKVVILGHRKLAARLVEEAEKRGGFGFNFLHKE
ncbi:hypothetical protein LOTGIDRAFT_176683, partial [Lottia gigantea]